MFFVVCTGQNMLPYILTSTVPLVLVTLEVELRRLYRVPHTHPQLHASLLFCGGRRRRGATTAGMRAVRRRELLYECAKPAGTLSPTRRMMVVPYDNVISESRIKGHCCRIRDKGRRERRQQPLLHTQSTRGGTGGCRQ